MATTTGQVILSNESQLISRNNRRYRRNPSESDGESTVIDQSEFTSRQGTENIDNYEPAYTESMGADEDSRTEQDYEPSTASTVSEDESDLIFEWQHERTPSTCTMIPESGSSGLARPKAGWDSSSFASFGTLVAAANNTPLLPQAPKTARFYWMIATEGRHGRNAGYPDDEYTSRIIKMMEPRLRSRVTSDRTREILSRRAELMPINSDWAQLTKAAWKEKFPESSIYSDPGFQKSRDPKFNRLLPTNQFRPENIDYIRNRPLSGTIQFDRSQKPVNKQSKTTDHKWSKEDQERVLNSAHATRAQQQMKDIRPDNQITTTMVEFEKYVAEFWNKGENWQKQPELAAYLARYKTLTEQGAFEQTVLLSTQNKVIKNTNYYEK